MDSNKQSANPFLRAAASGVPVSDVDLSADHVHQVRHHYDRLQRELARIPIPNGPNDTGVLLANKWDFFNLASNCAHLAFHALGTANELFRYADQFEDKDPFFSRVLGYVRQGRTPSCELFTMLGNIPGEIQDRWAEQDGHLPIPGGLAYRSVPRKPAYDTLVEFGMLAAVEKTLPSRTVEESQEAVVAESQYMDLLHEDEQDSEAPPSKKRKRTLSSSSKREEVKKVKEEPADIDVGSTTEEDTEVGDDSGEVHEKFGTTGSV
ncbi:hypothetical protein EIP86_010112 [Pleurotus ostreatoroseus]|nr:hypothetical protein EIP86_010112 [Pleurotus ostreatoroseus]